MLTFSIITPNFNSGNKLTRTLESILAQDRKFEFLIIDGGSTDGSTGIAHQMARDHPYLVRLFSESDRGIYDAMNKGIRLASGRYIYFLGAGDMLLPGVLNDVSRRLPQHEEGFVYGDVIWGGKRYDGAFSRRKLCSRNICHQAIFYGRDIFRTVGTYSLKYPVFADWEFNMRCMGCRRVKKQYVPLVIAAFELGGISDHGDPAFGKERCSLIRRNLGICRHIAMRIEWKLQKAGLIDAEK